LNVSSKTAKRRRKRLLSDVLTPDVDGPPYYFAAGPAVLPRPVKLRLRDELLDYGDTGVSILELGHRSDAFLEIVDRSRARLRALLEIPDDYRVLLLPAGARAQFSMIPMNLVSPETTVDFVLTGYWSRQAMNEAARYCPVNVAASSEADDFNSIPSADSWKLDDNAGYVYLTANETIKGVEFHTLPDGIHRPLVCDMTSSILTTPVDVSRYGLIFAASQKNLGTAGLCLVIVHRDLLGRARPETPVLFNYARQDEMNSLMNTPPVVSWYVMDMVLEWLQQQGGPAAMAGMHEERSARLYRCIDDSGLFGNRIAADCRSRVNISFELHQPTLRDTFLQASRAAGLLALEGHKSAGDFRASLYNAMPTAGVDALIDFLRDFESRHG